MQDPYIIIISFSLLVIFSYGFNVITKYTKIPAVILLMATGVMLSYGLDMLEIRLPKLLDPLRVIGVVGLMMIVLEGALDLKLKRDKWKVILTSFVTALIILGLTTVGIAAVIQYFVVCPFRNALIYAIPLSVVSSAIVIPSVNDLLPQKKEYMIYESTFSDILGIMLFDFIIYEPKAGISYEWAVTSNILISLFASILLSYIMVLVFQKVTTKLKIFLFLAVLSLLFSIGKYLHFSALMIILIFGLVLYNHKVFFRGFLQRWINDDAVHIIRDDFRLITEETSFLIRTFFFVIFGMTMELESLIRPQVIVVGFMTLVVIYLVRFFNLKVFAKSNLFPEISIAPRGLVTILLFIRIPEKYFIADFDNGILVFTIIATSLIMMFGLIISGSDETDLTRKNMEETSDESDEIVSNDSGAIESSTDQ